MTHELTKIKNIYGLSVSHDMFDNPFVFVVLCWFDGLHVLDVEGGRGCDTGLNNTVNTVEVAVNSHGVVFRSFVGVQPVVSWTKKSGIKKII